MALSIAGPAGRIDTQLGYELAPRRHRAACERLIKSFEQASSLSDPILTRRCLALIRRLIVAMPAPLSFHGIKGLAVTDR
jgi:hypothetical protein